ncbi:MAG: Hpt domain-containing protein [Planctomycetota bacterium]|jgi:HPt (histidine-containing phosphotransfer) domain-containing protein
MGKRMNAREVLLIAINKLSDAVKSGYSIEVKFYALAIKGAAGNFGVKRLSDIACQLECAGRENDIETATPLFDRLKTELEKVVVFLSKADWTEIVKNQSHKKNKEKTESLFTVDSSNEQ